MSNVADVYRRPGVMAFGRAMRRRWRPSVKVQGRREIERDLDYATLAELENAETPEALAEVIRGFLRRFTAYANKVRADKVRGDKGAKHEPRPPSEPELQDLMDAVYEFERPGDGVRVVRAALIAHALVRSGRGPADEDATDAETEPHEERNTEAEEGPEHE